MSTQPLLWRPSRTITRLTVIAVDRTGAYIPPRTKKNSPLLIRGQTRPMMLPSPEFSKWQKYAIRFLQQTDLVARIHREPITYPVNCAALIYRDRNVGDPSGYYDAIGDFLQEAGILSNDRLIRSWDGSRALKDATRPRIEITLTELHPDEERADVCFCPGCAGAGRAENE